MNMTKENIIRILRAKAENKLTVYRIIKDQPVKTPESERTADKVFTYRCAYCEVIKLMTDRSYFDEIANIYFPEE